jgi:two-component system, NtrC family, response regulator
VKPKILIIDDEENILKQMRWAFEPDYEVLVASQEAEAKRIFAIKNPPVVTLDLSLSQDNPDDVAGLRLLEQFLSQAPATRVIIVTGNNEESSALQAVRLGAFDYYCKPVRLDELKVMIQRAFHIHQLQERLQQSYPGSSQGFQGIIGRSKMMQDIFRFIERVAVSDVSILICGESGTGKELAAQAIHNHSQRRENPFVVVNCGAIPDNLLESELFGHEKGAFTGAYAQKRGKFELAHTGTLFLDEIGELAPPLQVKLLRFLQDRKIERVGGIQPFAVDVRIIAATNRDLKKEVNNHVFREDLYYRLKVVPLELPPLRQKREDIVPLAEFFLKKFCVEHHKAPLTLSSEAEKSLTTHPWPGNIRELENVISRAVVLSQHSVLKPSDLGFNSDIAPVEVNLKIAKKAIEADFIKKALTKNKGIVSRAAKDLGISRVNLYELMDRYNIQIKEFKGARSIETQLHVKAGEVF